MKQAQRKVTPAAPARAAQVRIIGGQWKRTPLPVLDAEGLRPTPDRVRETVFNWLRHLMEGDWAGVSCLDLFAGSGALGFEAASRGAARVVMVDSYPAVIRHLGAVCDKLKATQVEVVRQDALSYLQTLPDAQQFGVVFLDPPYHLGWLDKVVPLCKRVLAPGGLLYIEAEFSLETHQATWLEGWEVIRADKAGMVYYHVLVRTDA